MCGRRLRRTRGWVMVALMLKQGLSGLPASGVLREHSHTPRTPRRSPVILKLNEERSDNCSPALAWQFLWAWPLRGGQGGELPLLAPQQWSPQLAANWEFNMIDKVVSHQNAIHWWNIDRFENCKTYLELLAPRMWGLFASTRSARKLIESFSFLFNEDFNFYL